MLTPEQLEDAGELIAKTYRGIEADMLDYLTELILSGDGITNKTVAAASLLAQTHAQDLQKIINAAGPVVDEQVRECVEQYIRASDEDDMERMNGEGEPMWPRQVAATIAGMQAIIERDNLGMTKGAIQSFIHASAEAITSVNTGALTTEQALHKAVRTLEREGIRIITYQDPLTGMETISNHADVAIRRHIRTQIAQDGARLTVERMERYGCELVEVSSHCNARPEHAAWQGRVFGFKGAVTIDGTTYPDFVSSTGYGTVKGLMGANCRHSFGPYLHGVPRAYEPNPKHPSGLSGDEVYRLEQKQRYRERMIRDKKRELRGAQIAADKIPGAQADIELMKAEAALKKAQKSMRDFIKETNAKSKTGVPVLHRHPAREWAGDMPGAKHGKKATIAKPKPKPTPKPEPKHQIVEGKDIVGTWHRRPDKFDFEIDDVVNAQGFGGLPKIVNEAAFNEAVKKSGFIGQRAYTGDTKEIADVYRESLYKGDWYIDCSAGGAQYGQGMYCASDYTGTITEGLEWEMKHYTVLGEEASSTPDTAVTYIETMTLDPSAKIITWNDAMDKQFDEELYEFGMNVGDIGAYAAAKGYDAIKVEKTGKSGSYTVILNRTKLIIKEPKD